MHIVIGIIHRYLELQCVAIEEVIKLIHEAKDHPYILKKW